MRVVLPTCGPAIAVAVAFSVLTSPLRAEAEYPSAHDYVLNCAGCHRMDGSGSQRVPSLAETGAIVEIEDGREYIARVPGVAQAPLSDQRLAALLNWVVVRFGGANADPGFSAHEIAALRSRPFVDPRTQRKRLQLFSQRAGR